MQRAVNAFLLAVAAALPAFGGGGTGCGTITVPFGAPVMIDGTLDPGEWSDAVNVRTSAGRLFAKTSGGFVLLAIELAGGQSGFVDLYLQGASGLPSDLHASARLGERTLEPHGWTPWQWWNNRGWIANVSRIESFEARTFLPERVREFQIRRARFAGSHWRVRLDATILDGTRIVGHAVWPEGSNDTDPAGWCELTLRDGR